MSDRPASADALYLLARRELSVAECRARLLDRAHPEAEVDAALDNLLSTGILNDARVARTHARTAAGVKGRGRLRVARELHARGIAKDVADDALAEVFGDLDECTLASKALQRKLRGRTHIAGLPEYARLYRYLLRQGFSADVATAELRKLRGKHRDSGDV